MWLYDLQNILGLAFIVSTAGVMIRYGHDVFGTIKLTDAFNAPIAALPLLIGFLLLKIDIAGKLSAIRKAVKGDEPKPPGAV